MSASPRPLRRRIVLAGAAAGGAAAVAAAVVRCSSPRPAPTSATPSGTADGFRPAYHYSPRSGNLADPDGLV
ncbi:MAG: glycoside hydrolase family 32 protein, partial [Actinomyces sp.]